MPDGDVAVLISATAKVLGISEDAAMKAFGEHWSKTYAPGIYKVYFDKCKSARDFLLNLDQVHVAMTRTVKDARPPRFEYDAKDPKVLVMHYNSHRGMARLMPGLVRGVAKYYNERVDVVRSGDKITIHFA